MREQPRTEREQPSRIVRPPPDQPQRGNELEMLRRFDALVGDSENPRIWRGID